MKLEKCHKCGVLLGYTYKRKSYPLGDGKPHVCYKDQLKKKIADVPIETKQKILDMLRKGSSIGEIKDAVNLETLVVCGVINENIETASYLRTEAKV